MYTVGPGCLDLQGKGQGDLFWGVLYVLDLLPLSVLV